MKKVLPSHFFRKLLRYSWQMPVVRSLVPDEWYLKNEFQIHFGKRLDFSNPQTYSEKLQWLKVYDRNPAYSTLVDKYKVKEYVAQKIGKQYVIPLLGVWDSFDSIDFSKLPKQFVLKCNHDSGSVVVCKDKSTFDYDLARKKLERSLKRNFFYYGREWPYKNVAPKIIAESYVVNESEAFPVDYKFMCFNGKVQCSYVGSDRGSEQGFHMTFFDREWNLLPFEKGAPRRQEGFPKPLNYSKMLELAEKLSEGIPFLRVDFYEVNERVYFGELTFFPGDGFNLFQPEEWDRKLGDMIALPQKKR